MAIFTSASSLPLHEETPRKNTISRAIELSILFLLTSLLIYRIASLKHHGNVWLLALLCESWFTLTWSFVVCIKWNQSIHKTYPQRLLQRRGVDGLPAVDMFVTTADAVMEPPILTVNTVLSLLAVDYPADKLACYVSDDGCSPLTFYALVEVAKFAKHWVPFCKKYEIPTRAPFRYFTSRSMPSDHKSLEFQQEWRNMKNEYRHLCEKIENAGERSEGELLHSSGEFSAFSNLQRNNHPSIVKVIWENKENDPNGVPHLVYVSREKRPKRPHHFKAGALNVLARLSGVMTNAPFMLNVDCDMYANNPQIVLHATCLLLNTGNEEERAFVQCPQHFYDGLKDDPFGNQMLVLHEYMGRGMASIQGPFYMGTGCFHRRKIIYGLSPGEKVINTGKWDLLKDFGNSIEFRQSVVETFSGSNAKGSHQRSLSSSVEAANQVAGCGYEHGTIWGKKVGWIYGSATEDALTGLLIHGRGWRSAYCTPNPPAFLGCAPSAGPASLTQQKRWATGLLEILFSLKNPLIPTLKGRLQVRQCIAYLWLLCWGLRSVPELCYAALPAYCIMTNSYFLPKVNDPVIVLPIGILVLYNVHGLSEYIRIGLSVRMWWNYQRMTRITALTAWLFGFIGIILKFLGLSQTMFELTQKEQNTSTDDDGNGNADAGSFTFNKSPMFVPGVSILLVNLTAVMIEVLRLRLGASDRNGAGLGEIICSAWVLISFWPFLKGLFASGKYGIPSITIWKSGALAVFFVLLCIRASRG